MAGVVLVLGAAVYAALVGGVDVTFNATPLLVGLCVVIAGLAGRQARLVPIGLTLAGWGAAVVLVREGPLPDDREAPAFMVGMALGLLAATLVTRSRGLSLTGPVIAGLSGGIAFYLAYDIDALLDWPLWAVALAFWGGFEIVRPTKAK